MNNQCIRTQTCGPITISGKVNSGGQGTVYSTTNDGYYLKVCDPEAGDIQKIKALMRNHYQTFCQLRFGTDEEVTCLPLEYLMVNYNGSTPAYLMKRAQGVELSNIIREKSLGDLDLKTKLKMAHSLCRALSLLHSRSVIHADLKPANFFYDCQSGRIQILDIDGGGYYGNVSGTQLFWPAVAPDPLYRAPEIIQYSWKRLWDETDWNSANLLIVQPDLWSLAVMLYQILIDFAGPFPTYPQRPEISGYTQFPRDACLNDTINWPMSWQRNMMQSLNPGLVKLFEEVFSKRKQLDNPMRPGPTSWRAAIDAAIQRIEPQAHTRSNRVVIDPQIKLPPPPPVEEEVRKILSKAEAIAAIASIPVALFFSTKFFMNIFSLPSGILFFLFFLSLIGIVVLSLRSTPAPKIDQDLITGSIIAFLTLIILGAATEWAVPFTIVLFPTLIVLSKQLDVEKQLTEYFQKEGVSDSSKRIALVTTLAPVLALILIIVIASLTFR